MELLKTASIALLFFINSIVAGALGIFHFAQPYVGPNDKTTATTTQFIRTGAQPTATTTANSEVPCDSNPRHNFCRKNTKSVYSEGHLMVGADPGTFVVLGANGNYGKDANNVYWIIEGEEGPEAHTVVGADPKTFQVLSEDEMYAKDAHNVYWAGYLIVGADPETFINVACGTDGCVVDARDKGHTYLTGQVVQEIPRP